jgi:hypothetical protein
MAFEVEGRKDMGEPEIKIYDRVRVNKDVEGHAEKFGTVTSIRNRFYNTLLDGNKYSYSFTREEITLLTSVDGLAFHQGDRVKIANDKHHLYGEYARINLIVGDVVRLQMEDDGYRDMPIFHLSELEKAPVSQPPLNFDDIVIIKRAEGFFAGGMGRVRSVRRDGKYNVSLVDGGIGSSWFSRDELRLIDRPFKVGDHVLIVMPGFTVNNRAGDIVAVKENQQDSDGIMVRLDDGTLRYNKASELVLTRVSPGPSSTAVSPSSVAWTLTKVADGSMVVVDAKTGDVTHLPKFIVDEIRSTS